MHWPLLSVGVTALILVLIMPYTTGIAVTMTQPLLRAMPYVCDVARQQKHPPEGYTKLLSNWCQVWVIADDDRNLTAQLSCLEPDQQIIQAMIQFAD